MSNLDTVLRGVRGGVRDPSDSALLSSGAWKSDLVRSNDVLFWRTIRGAPSVLARAGAGATRSNICVRASSIERDRPKSEPSGSAGGGSGGRGGSDPAGGGRAIIVPERCRRNGATAGLGVGSGSGAPC